MDSASIRASPLWLCPAKPLCSEIGEKEEKKNIRINKFVHILFAESVLYFKFLLENNVFLNVLIHMSLLQVFGILLWFT